MHHAAHHSFRATINSISLPVNRFLLVPLLSLLAAAALHAAEPIRIVTFSTILTEVATRVAGDHGTVTGLVKPGVDPHDYEPKPDDLKLVANAQLILLSAKHMEGYVGKLKEATGTKGTLIEVGNKFPSLRMQADSHHDAHDGHKGDAGHTDETIEDPHWWQSIDNVKRATKIIQDELTKIDPADKADFAANAAAYTRELDELNRWAKSEIAKLPRNQRNLVTSHDAFQYFARDYGFSIHPIEGVSPEDQPSSKKVAELISTIRSQHVKSIFLESIENPKVAQEITKESGAKVGGTLFADGLGEGDAGTYSGMFRHNVTTIVNGLK